VENDPDRVATADRFAPTPLLDFVGAALPEPEWAVEGIWPDGASGIIGGRPKDKKSTLAVELAISLSTGTPMFGNAKFPSREHAPVLYVQQENANTRVQRDIQSILVARGLGDFRETRYADGEAAFVDFYPRDEWLEEEPARFEVLSHAGFDLSNSEHGEWLAAYVERHRFKYVFLDPLYMLIGAVDEKDSAPLRPILSFLTALKNQLGCAAILTHHMSDKGGGNEAATLLGSTYIHGWYEAAILTRSTPDHHVTLKVDAQRDIGQSLEWNLQGLGVGKWFFAPTAQGQKDAIGRSSPQQAKKAAKVERLAQLTDEHPDWAAADFCQALNVGLTTLGRYQDELHEAHS
jgi:hypothetical protein